MRAFGVSPRAAAFSSVMSSTAAAPSEICDDEPAVWTPSSRATGFRLARASSVVSRRPSSRATWWVVPVGLPSSSRSGASSSTSWVPKRPSSHALAARCWLAKPKASVSSRVSPHLSAMRSAPSNCEVIS